MAHNFLLMVSPKKSIGSLFACSAETNNGKSIKSFIKVSLESDAFTKGDIIQINFDLNSKGKAKAWKKTKLIVKLKAELTIVGPQETTVSHYLEQKNCGVVADMFGSQ
mmetsp:Transcript_11721/g.10178  ORF Transcript_11721/g.10178 Transcript_11721/m.10178 type:complete len:108 (-) Transcript_11721:192-515(-)